MGRMPGEMRPIDNEAAGLFKSSRFLFQHTTERKQNMYYKLDSTSNLTGYISRRHG
jgi:hypothetical protein